SPRQGYNRLPFFNPFLNSLTSDRTDQLRHQWRRLLSCAPLAIINTERLTREKALERVRRLLGIE
ncbi:MAG: hypothetical protein ACK4OO_06375, partial [bacterium]